MASLTLPTGTIDTSTFLGPLGNAIGKITAADLDEMVYHIKGFVEAAEEISAQLKILDATIDSDLERATDAMGRLEAEIYTHLTYHAKELREPFSRLFLELCRELDARGSDHV